MHVLWFRCNPSRFSKIIVETRVDIEKTLKLAIEAEKGKNYNEAYRYYTRILEHDPEYSLAWLGKGFAAGMLSSFNKVRIEEARNCIIKGLSISEEDEKPIPEEIRGKGNSAILVYMYSEYDPKLRNIARNYYYTLAGHIGQLATSRRQDYNRIIELAYELMRLFTNAYIIPKDEKERIPFFTNSDIKSIIISLVNLIIQSTDIICTVNNYSSESIVNIRKSMADRVKISLMMSSELTNDPDITRMLNEFIEEAEKKDKCFIATATLGDRKHPYVVILRSFRDEVLTNSFMGRKLGEIYFLYSPTIAQVISQHNFLRKLSLYLIITPFTFAARYSMKRYYSKHIAKAGHP